VIKPGTLRSSLQEIVKPEYGRVVASSYTAASLFDLRHRD